MEKFVYGSAYLWLLSQTSWNVSLPQSFVLAPDRRLEEASV